jgi:carbon storage regulator
MDDLVPIPICRMQNMNGILVILFCVFKEESKMLVIGRKPGEYIMIGDDIMVKVVKSENGDLRLAIEAPKDIQITRGENYEIQKIAK